ncbi:hypothetical protein IWX92DRAFT_368980 [Phyllosticta citricarpa]
MESNIPNVTVLQCLLSSWLSSWLAGWLLNPHSKIQADDDSLVFLFIIKPHSITYDGPTCEFRQQIDHQEGRVDVKQGLRFVLYRSAGGSREV